MRYWFVSFSYTKRIGFNGKNELFIENILLKCDGEYLPIYDTEEIIFKILKIKLGCNIDSKVVIINYNEISEQQYKKESIF